MRLQPRNNVEILWSISVLPLLRDLDILVAALLLCLANFHPLLGRQVLSQLGKRILCQSQSVKERAILDRVQDDVVIGP